jgi:hypothetical protein
MRSHVLVLLLAAGCFSGCHCVAKVGDEGNPPTSGSSGSGNSGGSSGDSNSSNGSSTGGGSTSGSGSSGGSSGSSGGIRDGGTIEPSQLCQQIATATCDQRKRCGFLDDALEPDCVARETALCHFTWDPQVNAGLATVVTDNANNCLQALANSSCVQVPFGFGFYEYQGGSVSGQAGVGLITECDPQTFYQAAGQPGQACLTSPPPNGSPFNRFCAGGYCGNATPESDYSCGSCILSPPVGGPCPLTYECDQSTTYCGTPPGGGSYVCMAKMPDGTQCQDWGPCEGANCECTSPICVLGQDGGGVCGYWPLGDACEMDRDCGPNAYCAGSDLNNPNGPVYGICTASMQSGSNCASDAECPAGSSCVAGTCADVPYYSLSLGQACSNMLQCDATSICATDDGGQNYCLPRADVGGPCDRYSAEISAWCLPGLVCANVTDGGWDWRCAPVPSEGQPCDYGTGCKDELSCEPATPGDLTSYVCTRVHGPGEDCYENEYKCRGDDGLPGFCLHDGGVTVSEGPGTCSGLLSPGATCWGDGQCHSQKCLMVDGGPTFQDLNTGVLYTGVCLPECI